MWSLSKQDLTYNLITNLYVFLRYREKIVLKIILLVF